MMYRYSFLAQARKRPLEAMGGGVATLRGLWAVIWPSGAHDGFTYLYFTDPDIVRLYGIVVMLAGLMQFSLIRFDRQIYTWRMIPVVIQLFTIGIILTGYIRYDLGDVATAFYIAMWITQVWIWGDFQHARKYASDA